METTQPGTPWTMWSRTTETTGRCDAEKLRASCPVNYRTRDYKPFRFRRECEKLWLGPGRLSRFYFVLTIDMPSVQFLGCWGVILWKYDVVRGYPVLGGNGDECDDESRQMIAPAHQGNYYLLNLHVFLSTAHIAVWKHGYMVQRVGAVAGSWASFYV